MSCPRTQHNDSNQGSNQPFSVKAAASPILFIKLTCLSIYQYQLDDPDADVIEIAMQLVNATTVTTHAQAPLQTGDLKLVVDVIGKIAQRSLETIQHEPPSTRDEKVRKIAQVYVFSIYFLFCKKVLF